MIRSWTGWTLNLSIVKSRSPQSCVLCRTIWFQSNIRIALRIQEDKGIFYSTDTELLKWSLFVVMQEFPCWRPLYPAMRWMWPLWWRRSTWSSRDSTPTETGSLRGRSSSRDVSRMRKYFSPWRTSSLIFYENSGLSTVSTFNILINLNIAITLQKSSPQDFFKPSESYRCSSTYFVYHLHYMYIIVLYCVIFNKDICITLL